MTVTKEKASEDSTLNNVSTNARTRAGALPAAWC